MKDRTSGRYQIAGGKLTGVAGNARGWRNWRRSLTANAKLRQKTDTGNGETGPLRFGPFSREEQVVRAGCTC